MAESIRGVVSEHREQDWDTAWEWEVGGWYQNNKECLPLGSDDV